MLWIKLIWLSNISHSVISWSCVITIYWLCDNLFSWLNFGFGERFSDISNRSGICRINHIINWCANIRWSDNSLIWLVIRFSSFKFLNNLSRCNIRSLISNGNIRIINRRVIIFSIIISVSVLIKINFLQSSIIFIDPLSIRLLVNSTTRLKRLIWCICGILNFRFFCYWNFFGFNFSFNDFFSFILLWDHFIHISISCQ